MEFYASCPAAFEQALARELRALGIRRPRPLKGRVSFEGSVRDAYRVCLWSHLASRVLLVLGRFACATPNDLYQGTYDLPWHEIIRPGASIAVSAHGTNPELRNSRFSMQKAKDGIVDRMVDETGSRPAVDTHAPDARIVLTIRGDRASMSLDLSGEPLFKRLSRTVLARAPQGVDILRPDYAALVLAEAGFSELCQSARDAGTEPPVLVDLACADGGVLLEAAAWLTDRAPGAARTRWGFQGWAGHDRAIWRELLAETREREQAASRRPGRIIATDPDERAVEASKRVVAAGRIACAVDIIDPKADALRRALGRNAPAGVIVADTSVMAPDVIPSALRLATDAAALAPCASMPIAWLSRPHGGLRIPGRAPSSTSTLLLGSDELQLVCFASASAEAADAPYPGAGAGEPHSGKGSGSNRTADQRPSRAARATVDVGDGKPIPLLVPESEQFARRLIKVARQRRKWARREGITCYRVYDADLPDYSAAIDLYEGTPVEADRGQRDRGLAGGGRNRLGEEHGHDGDRNKLDTAHGHAAEPATERWIVVAEYAAPKTVDPELARDRMLDILAIAPRVLGVPPEHVHAKTRQRSRGGSQYGKQGASVRHGGSPQADATSPLGDVLIREGGLSFTVNFNDYLDTGIFLDHRITRGLVREHARQARTFLNLFAYTGTATCYAADAGVEETVTVDLSNTYLDWAERNMVLNGFTGSAHHFVRDDVLAWVEQQVRGRNRWDLIFCDPPTFSNSSRMGERTWDVQRDHVELLKGVVGLLEQGGVAIFSCNLRSFKPDVEALRAAGIGLEDITERTIPEDFQRNKRIHHCYLVRRL